MILTFHEALRKLGFSSAMHKARASRWHNASGNVHNIICMAMMAMMAGVQCTGFHKMAEILHKMAEILACATVKPPVKDTVDSMDDDAQGLQRLEM